MTAKMCALTLTSLLAAGLVAGCKKEPAEAQPTPVAGPASDAPGCDVARAYVANRLARFSDKSMVVVDAAKPDAAFLATRNNSDLTRQYDPGQENPAGWPKDPPTAPLVAAWTASGQASPFASCVDFRKVVEAAGVQMGKVASGEKPNKDGFARTEVHFAMPAISADGAEALVMEEGRTGSGSRISVAAHLRKDKTGAWKETDALSILTSLGS